MFTAVGLGARSLEGGGVEVRVSIKRDDGTEVTKQTFTGASLDEVSAAIAQAVEARRAAEMDVALNTQVVGQTLATVDVDVEGNVVKETTSLRSRVITGLLLLVLLLAGARVWAQAPPAEPAQPTLTELERAKAELLQVRTAYAQLLAQYDACKAEVGTTYNTLGQLRARAASDQLSAEETQLKATVEGGHKGWRWDPKTGLFTKIEEESKAPAPASTPAKGGGR